MLSIDYARGIACDLDAPPVEYGWAYWAEYRRRRGTPMARRLNEIRVSFVGRHLCRSGGRPGVLDVGIGCGEFLDVCPLPAWGYDVNPIAVLWLQEQGLWHDPYEGIWPDEIGGVTLWDVFEHLARPCELLQRLPAGCHLFLSLPIFPTGLALAPSREGFSSAGLRRWKHYKPGEHLWYFTRAGLVGYVEAAGYELLEYHDEETAAGREAIESFCFVRRGRWE